MNVILTLCLRVVVDELICVAYDTKSSSGLLDGSKVTTHFTLAFSFSQVAVLQTL